MGAFPAQGTVIFPEVFDGVAGIIGEIYRDMITDTEKAPQIPEMQSVV